MGQLVGYARVSTIEQDMELQIEALKKYGCTEFFVDKQTGSTMERKNWQECRRYLRPGDTLVVWKLDRLGRRAAAIMKLIDELQQEGIKFISIMENLSPETPAGKAMMQMICVFAEMERSIIAERTKAGLQIAKQRGASIGRPKKISEHDVEMIKLMFAKNIPLSQIAKRFKVNPSTIWRAVGSKSKHWENSVKNAVNS